MIFVEAPGVEAGALCASARNCAATTRDVTRLHRHDRAVATSHCTKLGTVDRSSIMTEPDRIQRIAAAVHECAVSWEPGARLIGNVTADEIRELAIAASQAVAPVDPEPVEPVEPVAPVAPVPVVWSPGPFGSSEAHAGPLVLSVWTSGAVWGWDVMVPTERGGGGIGVARIDSRHPGIEIDAAKAAAIAAARAWRDSIRL